MAKAKELSLQIYSTGFGNCFADKGFLDLAMAVNLFLT